MDYCFFVFRAFYNPYVISYNYGAGKQDRVRQAILFAIQITTLYAAVLWLFMMIAPGTFSQLFTNNTDVKEVSMNLIRIYVFGMILSGVQSALIQSFVGRGMKKYSLIVSLMCKGMYVPFLLIFPILASPVYSVMAIYAAQAVTDILESLFIAVLYKKTNDISVGKLKM